MDPKMKLGIAAAVAVVALSVAGYLGYNAMGGGRTIRSASAVPLESLPGPQSSDDKNHEEMTPPGGRTMELEGEAPAWMQDQMERISSYSDPYEFPDSGAAASTFDNGTTDLALRAESDEALTTMGIATRRSLIKTWSAFMRPLLSGDSDAFVQAISDMGSPNAEGAEALHGQLSEYLSGARIAMNAARIIPADPTQRGSVPMGMPNIPGMPQGMTAIPMMIGVMQFADDQTGETTTIREINIPLESIFPDAVAAAKEGARTVEVWAPAKMKSGKGNKADLGPSVFFTFDDQTRSWQPVAMKVALISDAATSNLNKMMRSRQRATED